MESVIDTLLAKEFGHTSSLTEKEEGDEKFRDELFDAIRALIDVSQGTSVTKKTSSSGRGRLTRPARREVAKRGLQGEAVPLGRLSRTGRISTPAEIGETQHVVENLELAVVDWVAPVDITNSARRALLPKALRCLRTFFDGSDPLRDNPSPVHVKKASIKLCVVRDGFLGQCSLSLTSLNTLQQIEEAITRSPDDLRWVTDFHSDIAPDEQYFAKKRIGAEIAEKTAGQIRIFLDFPQPLLKEEPLPLIFIGKSSSFLPIVLGQNTNEISKGGSI